MTRTNQRIENMMTQPTRNGRLATGWALIVGFTFLPGCQTLAGPQDLTTSGVQQAGGTDANGNPIRQVSDETITEKTKKNGEAVLNFVTGKEQVNESRAKNLYQEGDALFRQAKSETGSQRKKSFQKAARLFQRAGEAAPATALEQDALFMQAEGLFFADRLTAATDVYQSLQKKFPRNRHIDRVGARLFSISQYWIDTSKADAEKWFTFNLTDSSRPRLDADGHAIRVLDQIRYDDPTGRLADDATMAAAAEYIRQQKFEEADEFLTDLRETFTDSEHLFLAHMLGVRVKLETYAGPAYSGLVLEEAETLVRQTRQRFPDRLTDGKHAEMVARMAAEIAYLRAERLAYRADYREKRKEYGAARFYYNMLLQKHPDTPQADVARERLQEIETYPAIPQQRLSWLTTIFPDSKRSKPLQTTQPLDQQEQPPETMLR